jgi:hypothetical protein
MSSIPRHQSQLATNALYVNIAACQSSIFDMTGARANWVTAPGVGNAGGALTAAGAVFRDMGKTVFLPNLGLPSGVAHQSTILRKVQFVPQGNLGFYGTGGPSSGDGTGEFFTGYISLGGQTYGGGGAGGGGPLGTTVFVRAN